MALMEGVGALFGGDAPGTQITTAQAVARAALMYGFAIVAVRIGKNRLLGQMSVLDIILIYFFGSVWSRAINGSGTLSVTVLSTIVLLALHAAFMRLTFWSDRCGRVLKGEPIPLIQNGKILEKNLARTAISRHDLGEALRLQANLATAEEVQEAYLERNGQIGVVRKP